MPRKFRKGRQHKSGTGNSKRIPAARLLVRPGDRRALAELDDKGESLNEGALPRVFVRSVCLGPGLCWVARTVRKPAAGLAGMHGGRPWRWGRACSTQFACPSRR